jgi:helix-turn-helix protein
MQLSSVVLAYHKGEFSMTNEPVKSDAMHGVPEVARRLGLKPSTIRRMIYERRIDVFYPSKRAVRVSEKTIREVLERGFRPAVSAK